MLAHSTLQVLRGDQLQRLQKERMEMEQNLLLPWGLCQSPSAAVLLQNGEGHL